VPRKRIRKNVYCDNCGHEFMAAVLHEKVPLSDLPDAEQWVPTRDWNRGMTCPACGHATVRLGDF
jgi:ribosomal protein S27AE